MINFIDSDLGRPITHISTNIRYDHLSADIDNVLRTSQVVEKEVQLVNGKNLLMRILPYITRDRRNEGIIVSFVDITTVTNLNNIIRGVQLELQRHLRVPGHARPYRHYTRLHDPYGERSGAFVFAEGPGDLVQPIA